MTKEKEALALKLLAQLVELCKREQVVALLATVLGVTPQSIYAWSAPESSTRVSVIKPRAAKQRLLEISRLKREELKAVVSFANEAVVQIESADAGAGQ